LVWITVFCTVLSTLLFSATVWTVQRGQIFSTNEDLSNVRVTRDVDAADETAFNNNGRRRYRQATRLRCEGNELRTLAFRGGSEGAKYHRLACAVLKLKEMLDSFSNDFNGMVFFVNNVGAGVQDLRAMAEQNKADIAASSGGGGISEADLRNMTSSIMSRVAEKLEQLNVGQLQDLLNEQGDDINELKVNLEVEEQKTEWLMGENQKLYYSLDEMNVTLQTQKPGIFLINGNSTAADGSTVALPTGADVPLIVGPGLLTLDDHGNGANLNHSLSKIETVEESVKRVSALMTTVQGGIKRLDDTIENSIAEDWFNAPNGYQYYLSKAGYKTDSYARSRRYCTYQKADLAHIGMRHDIIYRYLWNNLLGPGNQYCIWIGLTDKLVEGKWKWVDDSPIDDHWTNWRSRMRTTHALSSIKDCVMIRNGLWEEGQCSGLHQKVCSFVCERKIFR